MKLVEVKDIKTVVEQFKSDVERLSKIEITDNEQVKALRKKLADLKTALEVNKQLGINTEQIEKEIKSIEERLRAKETNLSDKDRLLLKLLEKYGCKVNYHKSGGKSVKSIVYITDKGDIMYFKSFGEIQRNLGIEGKDNNPKRVIERWCNKTAPKCCIIADGRIFYCHPEIKPELYQKYLSE